MQESLRFMLAIPQKRKREEMLLILSNTPTSKQYNLCLNPCLDIPFNKFSQNFMLRFMQSNMTWILTAIETIAEKFREVLSCMRTLKVLSLVSLIPKDL